MVLKRCLKYSKWLRGTYTFLYLGALSSTLHFLMTLLWYSVYLSLLKSFLNFAKFENGVSSPKTDVMCMHHLLVIWDFKSSVCHLEMKHKGSISCKYSYFSALILLAIFFFHSEYIDISQEGKIEGIDRSWRRGARGWCCGQAQWRGHNTQFRWYTLLLSCFGFCTEIYLKLLFFFNLSFPSLPFSFFTDNSSEEGAPRLLTKEERDIDTLQSWVHVGGFPAWPEEEAWGLLVEVSLPSFLVVQVTFVVLLPCFPFDLFFVGAESIKVS